MFFKLTYTFKTALFPNKCISCGKLFYLPEPEKCVYDFPLYNDDIRKVFRYVMSPFLCEACISGFTPIESPVCPICGFKHQRPEGEDHVCGKCLTEQHAFHIARSVGIHDDALMTAIHHLKYKRKIQLAGPLSIILFNTLVQHYNIDDIDMIVPVPLHIKRMRYRGFNQAYLLVKSWQKHHRPDTKQFFNIDIKQDIMVRHRHTPPQAQLDKAQRKINLKNAFDIKASSPIAEKKILLIDDVFTTGATVDECAKVLLKNGAKQVDVLTLSRAE